MSRYFPEPQERDGGNVKIELGLSNYATKPDMKDIIDIKTSNLASKIDLTSLKAKVDNLDVDKLNAVPFDLNKLSNLVDSNVVKKVCIITWLPK